MSVGYESWVFYIIFTFHLELQKVYIDLERTQKKTSSEPHYVLHVDSPR